MLYLILGVLCFFGICVCLISNCWSMVIYLCDFVNMGWSKVLLLYLWNASCAQRVYICGLRIWLGWLLSINRSYYSMMGWSKVLPLQQFCFDDNGWPFLIPHAKWWISSQNCIVYKESLKKWWISSHNYIVYKESLKKSTTIQQQIRPSGSAIHKNCVKIVHL